MKRTLAFWALLSLFVAASFATVEAQAPVEASGDTLTTGLQEKPAEAEAAADTAAAGARSRRAAAKTQPTSVVISLGLGSAVNYAPDSFADGYDPSLGMMLSGGIRRWGVTITATADYNFFFSAGTETNDLNVLMLFGDLRYVPVNTTVRPYVLVCGGLYRTWIVDLDYTENVIGYGAGAGVEFAIGENRLLFIEGRYVNGQTRERTEQKVNTEVIPFRLGITWEIPQ